MNQGGTTIWLYRLFAFFWQYWLIGQNVLVLWSMSAVKSLHIFYRADYSDLLCTESIEEALDSLDLIKYHIYRIE